jgi:hypothetical protein
MADLRTIGKRVGRNLPPLRPGAVTSLYAYPKYWRFLKPELSVRRALLA